MEKSNIVLSGFMASGKTTVGNLLSEATGMPMIDIDLLVQEETGRTVSEIFAAEGEARFRALETAAIVRMSSRKGIVLAVGGGAVLYPANVRELKSGGIIYMLDVSPEEVERRADKVGGRPLLGNNLAQIKELISEREKAYREAADVLVLTTGRDPGEVAREIASDFESRLCSD